MSSEQQRNQQQQQAMLGQLQQQRAQMTASQQQQNAGNNVQMQMQTMGSKYEDLPIMVTEDMSFFSATPGSEVPTYFKPFEFACQQGLMSIVQSIIAGENPTPAFLHHGLTCALASGHVHVARYLLTSGAPIVRETPSNIFFAPFEWHVALFDLLSHFGWTPNTPTFYGAVFLPRTVTNIPLLRWFLDHGADPNAGQAQIGNDRRGGSSTRSCAALEAAAVHGELEAVGMLLDAGARIEYGVPLHLAAGACSPGANPHAAPVIPTRKFDIGRIPMMALLVSRGADVNRKEVSQHMVAQYPIVHAVMAGAIERVRWLLEHGADPHAKGDFGTAIEYARHVRCDEIVKLIENFLKDRV
ncbi:unnamed protein product [Penicillium salamii]|uniref:Uncharacterized protein n=1 Tax=Penicillium salamii TaxID=1612424 RepID=A0A9W4NX91_9EURO|nr:unnamed protein product [Penicillium salamii]CAG8337686.1 unnamed protein product [Penicillium salamii]CAG8422124.1 unnamed protein product [Penicillium salamii]